MKIDIPGPGIGEYVGSAAYQFAVGSVPDTVVRRLIDLAPHLCLDTAVTYEPARTVFSDDEAGASIEIDLDPDIEAIHCYGPCEWTLTVCKGRTTTIFVLPSNELPAADLERAIASLQALGALSR